ncbi:hypothetical protein [Acetobacter thailandicus]|uniref:hypothetical protein n=1 Tax=Acetobacter thailandicus TaxID=1502842 RepID=UPI001BA8A6E1|nr:hypothetical protein [Acetobacter thailandicus]MBS0981527.1 hypothetical protein [Acetobacter thailandicus]
MIPEISILLDKIDKQRGCAEPPATQEDINIVNDYLIKEFKITLPKIWSDIWLGSDGISENGLNFYTAGRRREVSRSFIEVNKLFK